MRISFNRLPRAASLLAAIVIFSTCSVAFAQQPGEDDSWNHETAAGNNLQSRLAYKESRSDNGQWLVRAWTNLQNHVEISIDNTQKGVEGTIIFDTTSTEFSPEVIWITGSTFVLCHTGTDQGIYCASIDAADNELGSFSRVLDLKSLGAVSGAHIQLFPGDDYVYFAYTGSDHFLYAFLMNVATGDPVTFRDLGKLNGESTFSSLPGPAVAYNPVTQMLYVAVVPSDGKAQATKQPFGASSWGPWVDLGFGLTGACARGISIAPVGNPNMLVSCVSDGNGPGDNVGDIPGYGQFDVNLDRFSFGTLDITHWRSLNPVNLTYFDGTVYGLFSGTDLGMYWKRVFLQ